MALHLETTPGSFARWDGEAIFGTRYPKSIASLWDGEKLATIGLYKPEPADPVPDGKVSTALTVQRVEGVVKWVHTLEDEPVPSVEDRKTALLSRIEAKRFEAETGGITVSGVPIRTDRETAAIITAARVLAAEDENFTVPNWKAAPGLFVSLDAPTIIAIADAVRGHVQACFDQEAALTLQIMAAESHGDLDAIDVDAGWPGN